MLKRGGFVMKLWLKGTLFTLSLWATVPSTQANFAQLFWQNKKAAEIVGLGKQKQNSKMLMITCADQAKSDKKTAPSFDTSPTGFCVRALEEGEYYNSYAKKFIKNLGGVRVAYAPEAHEYYETQSKKFLSNLVI